MVECRGIHSTVSPQITTDDVLWCSCKSKNLSSDWFPPPLIGLSDVQGFRDCPRCRSAMWTSKRSRTIREDGFGKVVGFWFTGRCSSSNVFPIILIENGERRKGGPQDCRVESRFISPMDRYQPFVMNSNSTVLSRRTKSAQSRE